MMKHFLPITFAAVLALATMSSCKKDIPSGTNVNVTCVVSVTEEMTTYGTAVLYNGVKGEVHKFTSDTSFTATLSYNSLPICDSLYLVFKRDSTKSPVDSTAGSLGYQCATTGNVSIGDGTSYVSYVINTKEDSVKAYNPLTKEIVDDYFNRNKSITLIQFNY